MTEIRKDIAERLKLPGEDDALGFVDEINAQRKYYKTIKFTVTSPLLSDGVLKGKSRGLRTLVDIAEENTAVYQRTFVAIELTGRRKHMSDLEEIERIVRIIDNAVERYQPQIKSISGPHYSSLAKVVIYSAGFYFT